MHNKIFFIIQARLGSTRFPGKILLPFYEKKSILELMIDKLSNVDNAKIIIATSVDAKNNELDVFCKNRGILCFRGSENDVLQRFIDAAEYYGADKIIRVCSDNPFLELKSVHQLVDVAYSDNDDSDYISFWVNGKPSIKTHYGFWTEFVTLKALKKVATTTIMPLYHEHVTNYIYEHPSDFNVKWIKASETISNHPDIRLTIDTEQDFLTAQSIYSNLVKSLQYPSIEDIVDYLDNKPELYIKMKEQILKNSK